MMLAFFAKPAHVQALVGSPCGGVFYTSRGWLQLGMQTLSEWTRPARGRGLRARLGAAGLACC